MPTKLDHKMTHLTHYYEPGLTYLLTTITNQRKNLFTDAAYAQIAHADIAFYTCKFNAATLAHVIMPDHIHWLLHPSPDDFNYRPGIGMLGYD